MDLNELAKRAHAASRSKGWWPVVEPREERDVGAHGMEMPIDWSHPDADVPTKLALIHSEISEALEAWRNPAWEIGKTYEATGWEGRPWKEYGTAPHDHAWIGDRGLPKPEGFPSELADIVIRCADLAGAKGLELKLPPTLPQCPIGIRTVQSTGRWPDTIGACLNLLHRDVADVMFGLSGMRPLGYVVIDTFSLAAHLGIDLEREIERKMAYNATRSVRHGGKRA